MMQVVLMARAQSDATGSSKFFEKRDWASNVSVTFLAGETKEK